MPPTTLLTVDATDNGGRRRAQDRRFLVSAPCAHERRANWERRSGYDRRFRRIQEPPKERRVSDSHRAGRVDRRSAVEA